MQGKRQTHCAWPHCLSADYELRRREKSDRWCKESFRATLRITLVVRRFDTLLRLGWWAGIWWFRLDAPLSDWRIDKSFDFAQTCLKVQVEGVGENIWNYDHPPLPANTGSGELHRRKNLCLSSSGQRSNIRCAVDDLASFAPFPFDDLIGVDLAQLVLHDGSAARP
jgi:hypothetical protein